MRIWSKRNNSNSPKHLTWSSYLHRKQVSTMSIITKLARWNMILIEEIKNRTFIGNSCFCDILNFVFSLPPFVSCCSYLVENIPKCFCYKILGRYSSGCYLVCSFSIVIMLRWFEMGFSYFSCLAFNTETCNTISHLEFIPYIKLRLRSNLCPT